MSSVHHLHASPRREGRATADENTGEVRVPLTLFHFDQPQAQTDLVLNHAEAADLHDRLGALLDTVRVPRPQGRLA
ncbi:hypothetical protein I5Q34_22930 [Streptomyces sp. AV19]|uniref:hypothetical protein n=1 Tax=Streptomyces sp. AV19 TaxID=2793068 RepID=UPI0018FE673B|nr:hypothetical protein [Streptomyces sp. AV19]MBH1937087.1 hypothetical protein [Streptomyces sp. AV19]MDG4533113.1 hypothetical protein [Streptomyces sp. AV19]